MQITKNTTTTITASDDLLGEVELPFEPTDASDVFVSPDGNTFTYVTYMQDPGSYHEFPEGVEFVVTSRWKNYYVSDVESWLERVNEDPDLDVFLVGVYEHGGIQYTLAGESIHSGDMFDYCIGAAIAVPTDYTNTEEAARAILDEYTNWCNGEVYGIITMERAESGDWEETDSCWGFIGHENAVAEAKSWAGVE